MEQSTGADGAPRSGGVSTTRRAPRESSCSARMAAHAPTKSRWSRPASASGTPASTTSPATTSRACRPPNPPSSTTESGREPANPASTVWARTGLTRKHLLPRFQGLGDARACHCSLLTWKRSTRFLLWSVPAGCPSLGPSLGLVFSFASFLRCNEYSWQRKPGILSAGSGLKKHLMLFKHHQLAVLNAPFPSPPFPFPNQPLSNHQSPSKNVSSQNTSIKGFSRNFRGNSLAARGERPLKARQTLWHFTSEISPVALYSLSVKLYPACRPRLEWNASNAWQQLISKADYLFFNVVI